MRALPEKIVFDTNEPERGSLPRQLTTKTAAVDREPQLASMENRR
jgi:hypothetical protein